MHIILFAKHHKPLTLRLSQPSCYLPLLGGLLLIVALVFASGYWIAQSRQINGIPGSVVNTWKQSLEEQKSILEETKRNAQAHIDALSQRLGQLQAHVFRVDALGQRLTKMAKLDKGEFNFDLPPAQGGPETVSELQASAQPDQIINAMEDLGKQLEDREQQLAVLETMMLHRNLQQDILPTGRPIETGWLSSLYGMRNDPFTGKREFHAGIDFAGKMGSDVVAVAAGVVTWSGDRYGFGNLVEIDHGNGYVTRYGHNLKCLVKVGDKVNKGQVISLMGTSGRSTGPHVHFEVLQNGRHVNPMKHLRAAN